MVAADTDRSPSDLSAKVVSLARMIDRLPPGEYQLRLYKGDTRREAWELDIHRVEAVRRVELEDPSR